MRTATFFLRLVASILITSVAAPLFAQADSGDQTDLPFDQLAGLAAEARDVGDTGRALELYRQALRIRRDWDAGWWWQGVLLYEQDKHAEAIKAFRVVTDLKPEMGTAWLMVGLCQFESKDYYRSLESLNRGLTLGLGGNDTLRFVGHFHKAILLNRFEEFESAFEILWLLARNHSEDHRLPGALGVWALRLPLLPHEVPSDRRDLVLRAGRAFVAASQEDVETATSLFESLLESYPEQPNVHYAFGQFLRVRDAERALEMFRKELEISPYHVPARLQITYLLMSRGQAQEALNYVQKALKIESDSKSAKYVLGLVFLSLQEFEKAITALEEAVAAFPYSSRVRGDLARAYFRVGRREDANAQLAEVQRLESQRLELEQGLITSGQQDPNPK